jgi:DNA polymerase-1
MILQVHDELLFEVPEGQIFTMAPEVKRLMEQAFPLKVPLRVDLKAGPNWRDMEPLV